MMVPDWTLLLIAAIAFYAGYLCHEVVHTPDDDE